MNFKKKCSVCEGKREIFFEMGHTPISNSLLKASQLDHTLVTYPLSLSKCNNCHLVQLSDFVEKVDMFTDDYVYFSSTSKTFTLHAQKYANSIINKLALNEESLVAEVAANDGYLLQWFLEAGIPCYGIEPTLSTATAARNRGIGIENEFLTLESAERFVQTRGTADLVVANNVLAHVPDILDFLRGINVLLGENGVATFEFPHLLSLIENNYVDTIYHEHFSYLSLTALKSAFEKTGFVITDVEAVDTHGGSYRVYAMKRNCKLAIPEKNVQYFLTKEQNYGLTGEQKFTLFREKAQKIKQSLSDFLNDQKQKDKRIFGYGAASKASTILNYCDIKSNLIECIIDGAPSKQNRFIPGANIPIYGPEYLKKEKPNVFIVFPWNIQDEIINNIKRYQTDFEAFVVIPELRQIY